MDCLSARKKSSRQKIILKKLPYQKSLPQKAAARVQLINFKLFFEIEGAFRLTCDTSTGPVALESQST